MSFAPGNKHSFWPVLGSALLAGAVASRLYFKGAIKTKPPAPKAAPKSAEDEIELTEELLYFGSIITRFDQVKGTTYSYVPELFSESDDRSAGAITTAADGDTTIALARFKPASFLGADYVTLCVPAIPATDIRIKSLESLDSKQSPQLTQLTDTGKWPTALSKPLLKSKTGKILGVGSGVRSALIKDAATGKWYRLKGCGNMTDGFPFALVDRISGSTPYVTIRGSSFTHTTHRELYMSEVVHSELAKHGLSGANRSVGWYEYELPRTKLERCVRTCVVTETLGNKRIGDHILTGLERLLPGLINRESMDWSALRNFFPKDRRTEEGVIPSWVQPMIDGHDSYIDLFNFALPEGVPPFPSGALQGWRKVWDQNAVKFGM